MDTEGQQPTAESVLPFPLETSGHGFDFLLVEKESTTLELFPLKPGFEKPEYENQIQQSKEATVFRPSMCLSNSSPVAVCPEAGERIFEAAESTMVLKSDLSNGYVQHSIYPSPMSPRGFHHHHLIDEGPGGPPAISEEDFPTVPPNMGEYSAGRAAVASHISGNNTRPSRRPPSRHGPLPKSSSFKGVTHYKRTGRWEAHIWSAGKQIYLGASSTAEKAARAFYTAVLHFRGRGADLNFKIEDYANELKMLMEMSDNQVISMLRKQSAGNGRPEPDYPSKQRRTVAPTAQLSPQLTVLRKPVVPTHSAGIQINYNGFSTSDNDLRGQPS